MKAIGLWVKSAPQKGEGLQSPGLGVFLLRVRLDLEEAGRDEEEIAGQIFFAIRNTVLFFLKSTFT